MIDFNPTVYEQGDPVAAFLAAMAEHGLDPGPIATGSLQRFDVEKKGDKAGWYRFYPDGIPAGKFGNWQSGLSQKWSFKKEHEVDPATWAKHLRDMARRKKEEEKELAKIHAEAKAKAEKIWAEATPATKDHPYLKKKRVDPNGLRVAKNGRLIVPVQDIMGDIRSLQFIPEEGNKKFLTGGEVSGNFFTIQGANDNKIFICEGFATAATVHAATDAKTIVAFNTGNLKAVAKNIKDKFGSKQIIICADNDTETKLSDGRKNPGKIYGQEAADSIGAKMILPEFKNPDGKATSDFNDLERVEGLEAVKLQILGAPKRFNLRDWTIDAYRGPAPERKWLVRHTFPMGAPSLLAAMGDAGKGMLLMQLALNIAAEPIPGIDLNSGTGGNGRDLCFGNQVLETGTAVIFSAEDDKDEVHRRLESIDPEGRRFDAMASKRLIIVPLPAAGGSFPLVTPGTRGPEASRDFFEIREMLLDVEDLKLAAFDPLASFVRADINADPAVGSYTTDLLSQLSSETGAAIIAAHHMGKTGIDKAIKSAAQARHMIRGTTAIVDGVRAAYCLWPAMDSDARSVCDKLGYCYESNRVFKGALVKSNGPGDREVKNFVRNERGLLVPEDDRLEKASYEEKELKNLLIMEIQAAAEDGQPFTQTGTANGLYEHRDEFGSPALKKPGRDTIRKWAKELIVEGAVVLCTSKGSTSKKWLDVPGGGFAEGRETYRVGSRTRGDETF